MNLRVLLSVGINFLILAHTGFILQTKSFHKSLIRTTHQFGPGGREPQSQKPSSSWDTPPAPRWSCLQTESTAGSSYLRAHWLSFCLGSAGRSLQGKKKIKVQVFVLLLQISSRNQQGWKKGSLIFKCLYNNFSLSYARRVMHSGRIRIVSVAFTKEKWEIILVRDDKTWKDWCLWTPQMEHLMQFLQLTVCPDLICRARSEK